jgi:hypothetical protein
MCPKLIDCAGWTRIRNDSGVAPFVAWVAGSKSGREDTGSRSSAMNGIIYLVGLIVVIMAILSFLGLH